jgi:hypothetical protein
MAAITCSRCGHTAADHHRDGCTIEGELGRTCGCRLYQTNTPAYDCDGCNTVTVPMTNQHAEMLKVSRCPNCPEAR